MGADAIATLDYVAIAAQLRCLAVPELIGAERSMFDAEELVQYDADAGVAADATRCGDRRVGIEAADDELDAVLAAKIIPPPPGEPVLAPASGGDEASGGSLLDGLLAFDSRQACTVGAAGVTSATVVVLTV